MYNWVQTEAFNTKRGALVGEKHPWARSLMVMIRNYHRRQFPRQLAGYIGRCYQVDERIERGDEHAKIVAFFDFLKAEGIRYKFDEELPARMSAARAGVVTYGKNCFIFAKENMRGASWLESIPILLDADIEHDEPSIEFGCPDWCQNACQAACPTGALYDDGKMNPRLCIAYNSYYGKSLTPRNLREQMGTWIYGCDRCQEVCPRNLWPLTFYIAKDNACKWQANAARALGNLGDRDNIPHLITAFKESPHEAVRGMSAWAMGRLGGSNARDALEARRNGDTDVVKSEIENALGMFA
jgi:epoxyqueuosine reductase